MNVQQQQQMSADGGAGDMDVDVDGPNTSMSGIHGAGGNLIGPGAAQFRDTRRVTFGGLQYVGDADVHPFGTNQRDYGRGRVPARLPNARFDPPSPFYPTGTAGEPTATHLPAPTFGAAPSLACGSPPPSLAFGSSSSTTTANANANANGSNTTAGNGAPLF
jgi:hypothetical protein